MLIWDTPAGIEGKLTAAGLAFVTVRVEPTERFTPPIAVGILQAGKNMSGDMAPQRRFLRNTPPTAVLAATAGSVAEETCGRQECQLYHQLE